MAVKTKAILVGAYEGNKVYYLLRPYGEQMLDGAVVSPDGQIDFVKFFHFITTTPTIQELKFSKFHKFLWSPGSSPEERDKWNRIFLKKTQPIGDDLLVGAKIITSLGEEEVKRKDYRIRADEFRRKIASTGSLPMEKTVLSRKSVFNMRGIVGFKALGPLLSGKPSVDGDGDGFVDDGLPTMRPFIPGFDFLPDSSTNTSLRSITTRRADKAADRSATREEMLSAIDDVAGIVSRRHNDGKKIKTRKDAMDILKRLIPSFGLSPNDKARSSIEFLDSKADSDSLKPWELAYINQFLLMFGDDASRNEVTWRLRSMDPRIAAQGAGGYTSVPLGAKDWEFSQKFSDEGPRLLPKKNRKPLMTIGYSAETDKQNSRIYLLGLLMKQDKRNFTALSYAISKALRDDLNEMPDKSKIMNALQYKYGLDIEPGIASMSEIINQLLQGNNLIGAESQVPSSALGQDLLQTIWNVVNNSADAIAQVDSSFDKDLLVSRTLRAIQQGSIADILKSLRKTREAYQNSLNSPGLKMHLANGEELLDKWLTVNSKLVGVHESAHGLHFLRILESNRKKAQKLRDEYLQRYIDRQKEAGLTPETFKELQKQLPIEAFYTDVFKDEIREYAQNSPELLRRDILMLTTGGTAGRLIPDFQKLNGTSESLVGLTSTITSAIEIIKMQPPGVGRYDAARAMGAIGPFSVAGFMAKNPDSIGKSNFDDLVKQAKAEMVEQFIQQMESWLGQPIFMGDKPVALNGYMADLLNKMQASIPEVSGILGLDSILEFKAGDSITPAIASLLINPAIQKREQSARRNIMRGIRMFESDGSDSLTLGKVSPAIVLSTLGFPDIKGDDGNVMGGGRPEDVKPLIDALIGVSSLVRETEKQLQMGVQNIEQAMSSRSEPDAVDLPSSFGDISLSEFMEMPIDDVLEKLFTGIDDSLSAVANAINSGTMSSRLWENFEIMPKTGRTELSPLNQSEIKIINDIARKIGLPAGVQSSAGGTGLSSLPAQGYSSYQATLTDPTTWLGSTKWSIGEFVAESAVADFMGIPFSQIADSGLITRELTNEELQVLNKLMQWVFSGRLPSDRMSEAFNP